MSSSAVSGRLIGGAGGLSCAGQVWLPPKMQGEASRQAVLESVGSLALKQLSLSTKKRRGRRGKGAAAEKNLAAWKNMLQSPNLKAALVASGLAPATTRVGPSPIHGNGLFAAADIPKNTFVTLYPLHGLRALFDASVQISVSCSYAQKHFPQEAPKEEILGHFTEAYKSGAVEPCVIDIDGCQAYADSRIASDPWYLAHLVNDAVSYSGGEEEEYSQESREKANCAFVLYGPFPALLTTRDVSAGQELLASYGTGYWSRKAKIA